MNNQLEGIESVRRFFFGGEAILTIENPTTGGRFTFRISKKVNPDNSKLWFVSVLTGPNNESDYTFLGTIFDNGKYYHGKKSSISDSAKSAKSFQWFYSKINNRDSDISMINVYHEGFCARCGRKLTTPESIISGFGPVCINKAA